MTRSEYGHIGPYFIQGSQAPVFCGDRNDDPTFDCAKCGYVLIKNYVEQDYAAVGIMCFKCGAISMTPEMTPGEIFSVQTLSMGRTGALLVGDTVYKPWGHVISHDAEIEKKTELTRPALHRVPFGLGEAELGELAKIFEKLTQVDLHKQLHCIERSPEKFMMKFPFAWGASVLMECFKKNEMNLSDRKVYRALVYVYLFHFVHSTWHRHPRFSIVGKAFGASGKFFHTAGIFAFLYISHMNKSPVGLSLEDIHGEPNPDLYVRGTGQTVFLELKAPQAFQHVGRIDNSEELRKALNATIHRSKSQINSRRTGALVMFATGARPQFGNDVERLMEAAIQRTGRQRPHLAALILVVVAKLEFPEVQGQRTVKMAFGTKTVLNPYFDGQNPVTTFRA